MLTVGERDGGRRRNSVTMEPTRRRLSVYESATTARRKSFSGSSHSTNFSYSPRRSIGMAHRLYGMPEHQPTAHAPTVRYLNTYKLAPDDAERFRCKPVQDIIESTLKRNLENCIYSPAKCSRLTASIAEEIKDNVKLLGFERYKIVCCAQIGSLNDQAIRSASRCLWDTSSDCAASGSFSNESLFACVTVFGVYGE